jgi:RND family efflux transporter MFP subunit
MKKLFLLITLLLSTIIFAQELELSATVVSDNEKFITSRFMGFIQKVNVSEGDRVKRGELLYSIDSTDIDSKKRQALLAVQMYENQYITMKRNYERYKRLFEKGLVSKFEVEQLELGTKNLEDMIDISKAQVKEVENQYQYLTIKAPNDGVIIKKNIKSGEMAIPGMPALVLTDLSDLKITAEIAESDLFQIKLKDEVKVDIPSINYQTIGTIDSIIPSSNPMSHTYTIKIGFKSIERVYPGMYAKIYIKVP